MQKRVWRSLRNDAPVAREGFIREAQADFAADPEPRGYPWDLPAIAALGEGLPLDPAVTYLVGENGSGKSTLVEALAVAAGLNAEGGSRHFVHSTRESHSDLWERVRLVRGARRPKTDFFLRAESFFTSATYLESLPSAGGNPLDPYGGRSLHEQSHGESFLALLVNRFGPEGLYFLDEPEAALSAQNCLTCLRRVHELVGEGSQFVIATHSPILLAYPGAAIYECGDAGLTRIEYEEAEPVRLTRSFLDSRERYVSRLLAD
jgi:predicted ATPase